MTELDLAAQQSTWRGWGIRLGVFTNAAFYGVIGVSMPLALSARGFGKSSIAVFFAVGSVVAGALNLWVGPVLRRRGVPWWSISCAAAGGLAGLAGVHVASSPPAAWLSSAALAAMTLVFPLLVAAASGGSSGARLVSTLRAIFVAGFLTGLGLVSLVELARSRGVAADPLALAAVLTLLNMVAGWLTRYARRTTAEGAEDTSQASAASRWSATAAAAAVLAMVAADTLRLVYLPLYVVAQGYAPEWAPILMLTSAAAELPVLPVLGRLTDRFGTQPVLLLVCVSGLAAFALLGVGGSIGVFIAAQIVYAVFAAGVQSIGVVHLGGVMRGGLGAGAGLFAAILQAGALTGVAAPLLVPGYSGWIFAVAALFCVLAALLVRITGHQPSVPGGSSASGDAPHHLPQAEVGHSHSERSGSSNG